MVKVKKEVNEHFRDFILNWDYTTYFAVGGYGSSKSYNIGLKLILKLLQEKRKAIVVREVYETIKDSSYSLLIDIIESIEVSHLVNVKSSPLNIKFSNGSEIIFKGMDKPEKLKSINDISIIWIEEASEIKYSGYKELLGRARHPDLKIHFLLSTNPVSKTNWVYKHFFKDNEMEILKMDENRLYKEKVIREDNIYYHHSTVDDNMFLPQSYIDTLEEIKEYDLDLYRVARKGRFGTNGKKVLPQFEVMDHIDLMARVNYLEFHRTGMDFGFVNSYNAVVRIAVDEINKFLYIYWEYYKKGMTDSETSSDVNFRELKIKGDLIRADNAEAKTIKYFNQQGYRMKSAYKGLKIEHIKKIKRFKKIYCSDKCTNTISELQDLTFKEDRNGNLFEDEFNIDPHTFDAIKYALEGYEVSNLKDISMSRPKGVRRR